MELQQLQTNSMEKPIVFFHEWICNSCGRTAWKNYTIYTIKQLLGRMTRKVGSKPATLVYAGSNYSVGMQYRTDTRVKDRNDAFNLVDFLLETAHTEYCTKVYWRARCDTMTAQKLEQMKKDACDTGMAERRGDSIVITDDTRKLVGLLYDLDPRWSRLLINGVRLGIAIPVVALAALEMCGGRVFQQATGKNGALNYSCPAIDVFMAAFELMDRTTSRCKNVHVPGQYESELVALADLFGSFIEGSFWSPDSPEIKYQDYVGEKKNPEKWHTLPRNNFWRCAWTSGKYPRFESAAVFATLRERRRRYDNAFNYPLLYKLFIKDEGREAFHQALHRINRVLVWAEIIDAKHGSFLDPAYNKFTISHDSCYLNEYGRDLLSALATTCLSNVAIYNMEVNKFLDEKIATGCRWPVRFSLFDDNENAQRVIVHGYSTYIPDCEDDQLVEKYIMFAPSEDGISKSRERGGLRFHAVIHNLAVGHILMLGNIHGKCTVSKGDGFPTITIPFTGSPDAGKKMTFVIKAKDLEKQMNQRETIAASEALTDRIVRMRKFLADVTNASLCTYSRPSDIELFRNHLVKTWQMFSV